VNSEESRAAQKEVAKDFDHYLHIDPTRHPAGYAGVSRDPYLIINALLLACSANSAGPTLSSSDTPFIDTLMMYSFIWEVCKPHWTPPPGPITNLHPSILKYSVNRDRYAAIDRTVNKDA